MITTTKIWPPTSFRNEADCNSNNVDDDGNGYAIGVAGVNWKVKLYACKFLDKSGSGTTTGALKCFDYFALMKDRGVNLVATNNSWSNSIESAGVNLLQQSASLYQAIEGHYQRGILIFFAASNKSANNDMPDSGRAATTDLPNLISVAAIDSAEKLAVFSNYGRHTVHFAAPGVGVLSTVPKAIEPTGYKSYSGTSMASPHGAGVAALLKAMNPSLTWLEIRNLMIAGSAPIAGAVETISQGKLDAYGAMTCSNSVKQARLLPSMNQVVAGVGEVIRLRALNINCAAPNGAVTVTASPSGDVITLLDDGFGTDQLAGDGVYSGEWTVPSGGSHLLAFPNGDDVSIHISAPLQFMVTDFRINVSGASAKTIVAGSTATFDLQVEPLHGSYDRPVQFACSGLPAASQCIFAPASATPGAVPTTVQVSIRTTARSSTAVPWGVPPARPFTLAGGKGVGTRGVLRVSHRITVSNTPPTSALGAAPIGIIVKVRAWEERPHP